jgi:hypothetical protein
MASQQFDPKIAKTRVFSRYNGRPCNCTVNSQSARADAALGETIRQTIAGLERGRLTLPPTLTP